MDKKSKKGLLLVIEEQEKNLMKYKSRLRDIIGSYKHLVKEKETLENSIKTLTDASSDVQPEENSSTSNSENQDHTKSISEKRNDPYLQQLKSSLGALTAEKSRMENELKTDRKKILQQKEELEKSLEEKQNSWSFEKEKYEIAIRELRKKVSVQQREREKEQQDHVLMLKELQNILASERSAKEKLEEQVGELQQKFNSKVPEKKLSDYERCMEDLQNKLTFSQNRLQTSENDAKKTANILEKLKEEMNEIKLQYQTKLDEEKKRADLTDDKLKLLTLVKEKRIAGLESKISELSVVVGEHDKLRQQDQHAIQKLKARVNQLQVECSTFAQASCEESSTFWPSAPSVQETNKDFLAEKLHAHCQSEMIRIKEELEQYKKKTEATLKEKYNKTSATLFSDSKARREIKELKSRIILLQDQLQSCKAQLKLNEEYHNKITANLEKSYEDLKVQHKKELSQIELSHRTQLLELEHQIQKQRERTLSLLEEKDKEIGLMKSTFLSSFVKTDTLPQAAAILEDNSEPPPSDQQLTASLLSSSLISSKKDGHILHYIQELSRKDVEISNLRHSRFQMESSLRKLQHVLAEIEEKYSLEVDELRSRIKLLESSQDEEGTNVEYLKNVVLRFLKCHDHGSRRHMVNAIATVLHFTSAEVQDVKGCIK